MTAAVAVVGFLSLAPSVDLPTLFWGVTPKVEADDIPKLKRTKDKAVVLIHGLIPRPIHPDRAERPDPHGWQKADGALVKAVADEFDVFAFSYAQTVPVDLVVLSQGLRDGIATLKAAGYKEIALLGHSAGGIICRRFAECFPDAGVTKVVCVAAPFTGSIWARLPGFIIPRPQVSFIGSLLPSVRQEWTLKNANKVKDDVQFCCVVCKLPRLAGDTMATAHSQWPDDLQKQGVPAVTVKCNHFEAMTHEKMVAAMAEVLKGTVRRWDDGQVKDARKLLLGK